MEAGETKDKPLVVVLRIRRMRDEDEAICQGFDCGGDPDVADVNDYIHRVRWQHGRKKEHGLIAETPDGEMVGFGTWKHMPPKGNDDETVIRMAVFGIDQKFQGAVTPAGPKCAEVLYATLEADATSHEDSTPEMPVELFCHEDNKRGLRFWRKMGYEIVEASPDHPFIRMRLAPRADSEISA